MTIGTSLFLLAVGAILKYAVEDSVNGIDVPTVGLILMIVGVLGLVLSLLYMTIWSRDRRAAPVVRDREAPVVREREYPR
jgi:hypothetical protein